MSGWLDLSQLGLAPNQKHQALLGAPKIVPSAPPLISINTHYNVLVALNAATQAIFDDVSRYPVEFETVPNDSTQNVNKISK
jgi:hypothetical protein